MSTFLKSCVLISLIFFAINTQGQVKPNENYEIYLLMGQSNMAGRGPITEELKNAGSDSVFVLNNSKTWVLAKHPLHFDKPSAVGVGPGLEFGVRMAKAHKNVRIGLVPCAVGGTKIEYWAPGGYDPATKTHPYEDAVIRIKEAMLHGTIKGVIWHQGEANSDPQQVNLYLNQLSELIGRVRTLTGNPTLPFIAGELGGFYEKSKDFNLNLKLLPKKVDFTDVVSSRGLTDKGDKLHFDGSSATKLGRRYAKKMLGLQKQLAKR